MCAGAQIKLPNVDAVTLSAAVQFLQTGALDLLDSSALSTDDDADSVGRADGERALRLLQLCDIWDVPPLREHIEV